MTQEQGVRGSAERCPGAAEIIGSSAPQEATLASGHPRRGGEQRDRRERGKNGRDLAQPGRGQFFPCELWNKARAWFLRRFAATSL